MTFSAVLDGASNVPPIPGVTATGSGTFVLNDDETSLQYTITFQGLSSEEIAAHIHNAGARDNGPIAFTLPLGTPKNGTWDIPPDMVTELKAGRLYVNIHSVTYNVGEIRGSLMSATPVRERDWGRIKALYR